MTDYWVEDKLYPVTREDLERDARYCYLMDTYGGAVARLWMDSGCPEEFGWTEIVSSE